jgi:hypothetical protein
MGAKMSDEDAQLSNNQEMREVKLETARIERDIKAAELRQKNWDYDHRPTSFGSLIRSPVVAVAVFAALGTLAGTFLTYLNALSQRETDALRLETQTILEMVKTGDPDQSAVNLQFLVQSGLLQRLAPQVENFLMMRRPAQGPILPTAKKPPDSKPQE